MNLLGRIFVFLILVMSLVFMAFSVAVYSTHTNWREKAQATAKQLADETARRQALEEDLARLQETTTAELEQRQKAVAALAAELDSRTREYTQLANENAITVQQQREAVAAMQAAQTTLASLRDEVGVLREQVKTVQKDRDDNLRLAISTTDQLNQRLAELDRINAINLQIAEDLARAETVLDRNDLDLHMPVDGIPPKVDGRVVAVGNGLVEISIGADEGLRRGHTLEVFRGSKYLGRIEVERAEPDKAVAKILPEYRKGSIAKEDRVATRL